ncbi:MULTISPECIES: gluconate:H+ symporter [Pelosinus]|uniref:Gluconate transporter n=1 Tax=Pelosinus fermentans B4 TaxID=1149862 RepID=I9LAS9_9FIRM|nr:MULTISPECIES: gluconate:H+ symporter [Pelosinus]EIW17406.1 gluconate transporter [Pelosinus fermentans B4]EIW23465.1 gluconate transporter [Pelosinus fermentans A11]OAM96564.1 gluconate transporter [Pelosinus fermentans DSM 17108]SDR41395.1 D-serine permease DsdX [Pelosinus fermentans]
MDQSIPMLFVLGIAILMIIVLSIKFRIHAFLSLMGACFFIAFATGMPLAKIGTSIEAGMGGTLGFLAPILALGAIIGKMMEISGGAEKLSRTLINIMGKNKAAWAMMIVAYICGIPVFLQVGIVLLTPILFCVVLESKQPLVQVALSMLVALTVVHCVIPPHPAAMAISLALKADVGKVIFYGLLVGLPATAIAGPLFGKLISKKYDFQPPDQYCNLERTPDADLPKFGITLFTILLPLLLMIGKTIIEMVADKNAAFMPIVNFIGSPITALFLAAILSYYVMGWKRGHSLAVLAKQTDAAMGPMASIILVIGAAGAFNRIILDSGIGDVLKAVLTAIQISPLIMAWVIAIVMRFAIGSATVAMMTSAGFIIPVLAQYPNLDPALVAIAIGAGAIGASHVTDPGFWFVKESLGIPMNKMFGIYTASTTIASVVGLAGVLLLAQIIG